MNFEEIEQNIVNVENAVAKIKELVADAKVCQSEITKTLIVSKVIN